MSSGGKRILTGSGRATQWLRLHGGLLWQCSEVGFQQHHRRGRPRTLLGLRAPARPQARGAVRAVLALAERGAEDAGLEALAVLLEAAAAATGTALVSLGYLMVPGQNDFGFGQLGQLGDDLGLEGGGVFFEGASDGLGSGALLDSAYLVGVVVPAVEAVAVSAAVDAVGVALAVELDALALLAVAGAPGLLAAGARREAGQLFAQVLGPPRSVWD